MFEIGKIYILKQWQSGNNYGVITESEPKTVSDNNFPLIDFRDAAGEITTVNVASLAFVSAMEYSAQSDETFTF